VNGSERRKAMRTTDPKGIVLMEVILIFLLFTALLGFLCDGRPGQARIAKCMAQLKQIGIALQMYANDHDGFLPYNPYHVGEAERQNSSTVEIWRGSDNTAIGLGLLAVEGKYLSPKLLFCPSDKYHDLDYASNFGKPEVTLRSSYIYRCYCEGMGPKLEQKGMNSAGEEATVLVMDFNCLDIGEGKQAENHKSKEAICILYKDLYVRKVTNRHGMELYKQKIGDEWVLAPFPLVLRKDNPAEHRALWIAADESLAE